MTSQELFLTIYSLAAISTSLFLVALLVIDKKKR